MASFVSDIDQRLAAELDHARALLEALGDELAMNELVVAEHGLALQSVDIVGQMLGHIASVVRADDAAAAIERIGMCELKERLSRAA